MRGRGRQGLGQVIKGVRSHRCSLLSRVFEQGLLVSRRHEENVGRRRIVKGDRSPSIVTSTGPAKRVLPRPRSCSAPSGTSSFSFSRSSGGQDPASGFGDSSMSSESKVRLSWRIFRSTPYRAAWSWRSPVKRVVPPSSWVICKPSNHACQERFRCPLARMRQSTLFVAP